MLGKPLVEVVRRVAGHAEKVCAGSLQPFCAGYQLRHRVRAVVQYRRSAVGHVGVEIDKRMIDIQPIRTLGEHKAHVRLTIDIVPSVNIMVYREGETPNIPGEEEAAPEAAEEAPESESAE